MAEDVRRFDAGPWLRTQRLTLRPWCDEDLPPFAALNADPRVAEFLPSTLTGSESDAMAGRGRSAFAANGFGFWAVEIPGEAGFAGFIGLGRPAFEAHFLPAVEIGWRLASALHGRGYATEGAREVLRFAFEELRLPEVVSFTVPANLPSRRVMEKIGMSHDAGGDFDHPRLPEGHRLRRHVLYRSRP